MIYEPKDYICACGNKFTGNKFGPIGICNQCLDKKAEENFQEFANQFMIDIIEDQENGITVARRDWNIEAIVRYLYYLQTAKQERKLC